MNLHEYQAKELLRANGINIPKGKVSHNAEETYAIAEKLNSNLVIKAQIHAGGRGKAGGIKVVKSAEEAKKFASSILGKNLITHQNKPHGQPRARATRAKFFPGLVGRGWPTKCIRASSSLPSA